MLLCLDIGVEYGKSMKKNMQIYLTILPTKNRDDQNEINFRHNFQCFKGKKDSGNHLQLLKYSILENKK